MSTQILRTRYAAFALGLILFIGSIKSMEITFNNTDRKVIIEPALLPMFPRLYDEYSQGIRSRQINVSLRSVTLLVELIRFQSKVNELISAKDARAAYKRILANYNSSEKQRAEALAYDLGNDEVATLINSLVQEMSSVKQEEQAPPALAPFVITFKGTDTTVPIEHDILPFFIGLDTAYQQGTRSLQLSFPSRSVQLAIEIVHFTRKVGGDIYAQAAIVEAKKILDKYNNYEIREAAAFFQSTKTDNLAQFLNFLAQETGAQERPEPKKGEKRSSDKKFTITFKGDPHNKKEIDPNILYLLPKLDALYERGIYAEQVSFPLGSIRLVVELAQFKHTSGNFPNLGTIEKNEKKNILDAVSFARAVGADTIVAFLSPLTRAIGDKNYFADTPVLVSFTNDPTASPTSYPLFQVEYANTLKDLIASFGTIPTEPIPIRNTTKKDFESLLELVHPKKFGSKKPTEAELGKVWEELIIANPQLDLGKILEVADYLHFSQEALEAPQKGYISILKSTTYIPPKNMFDRFTKDWQRSIAGKLFKDLLEQQTGVTLSMPTSYKYDETRFTSTPRPILSISSTPWGFGLIDNKTESRYFDLVHKKERKYNFFVYSPEACALSDDATYMLLIGKIGEDAENVAFLINLETGKTTPIEQFTGALDNSDYKALYNDHDHRFYIIATENPSYALDSYTFTFYAFDPKNTNDFSKKRFQNPLADRLPDYYARSYRHYGGRYMQWNCIEGNLIGIFTDKQGYQQVLIYTGDELLSCSDPQRNNEWVYTSQGHVKNANFFVTKLDIPDRPPSKWLNSLHRFFYYENIVLEKSFIPDFEKILVNKWKIRGVVPEVYKPEVIANVFDPVNLYVNYIKLGMLGLHESETVACIYSPFALGLAKAIRILNRADSNILASAHWVYHHTLNQAQAAKLCQNTWGSVLPELKMLYNSVSKFEGQQPAQASQKKLSLQEKLLQPIVLQQPTPPKPQQVKQGWGAWLTSVRQNASQLWNSPRQYMNSIYTKYKDSILRSMALQRRPRPAVQN